MCPDRHMNNCTHKSFICSTYSELVQKEKKGIFTVRSMLVSKYSTRLVHSLHANRDSSACLSSIFAHWNTGLGCRQFCCTVRSLLFVQHQVG